MSCCDPTQTSWRRWSKMSEAMMCTLAWPCFPGYMHRYDEAYVTGSTLRTLNLAMVMTLQGWFLIITKLFFFKLPATT